MAIREKNLSLQLILMIIAWGCFFMLPFAFFPYNHSQSPFASPRFVNSFIASNIFLIIFYYLNNWVFIPSILARKKIVLYLGVITVFFLLYLTMMYEISVNSEETKEFLKSSFARSSYYKGPYFFAGSPMTLFLLAFVFSSGSKVISEWFTAEKVKEEITRQQLQTELSLLKSQVNPHFLFNTLNSIYSLSIANNSKSSDAVMKLSRIMRYTLEESKNDVVALDQEIDFIKSYIDLQKIRLTNNVHIEFETEGPVETVMLAPLLFIPFIENAFKYGISTHHPSTICVRLKAEPGKLSFYCRNDCFPNATKTEGTGTGILNTRRRLELLYNKKHDLVIQAAAHEHKVMLTLNL